jgi:fibronectin type 3 domain-containing protein
MKKIQLVAVLLLMGMFMVSCGGLDACDCAKMSTEWKSDRQDGMSNVDLEEKYSDDEDECKELRKEDKKEYDKKYNECLD